MVSLIPVGDFFGIPNDRSATAADRYVKRILDFSELVDHGIVDLVISDRTTAALLEEGHYPFIGDVRRLLTEAHTETYSAEDINRLLNQLVNNATCLEKESGISDVLFSDEEFVPAFDELPGISADNPKICADAKQVAVLALLWSKTDTNQSLVLGIACPKTQQVYATVVVQLVDGKSSLTTVPQKISGSIDTAGLVASLVGRIDSSAIFLSATRIEQAELAVRIAILQEMISVDVGAMLVDVPSFKIADEFLSSADRYSFRGSEGATRKLMRCLVDVALGRDAKHGHPIRINSAGSSPPVMRGADVAFRHDIDYEFHLHYWRCSTGPEFASVVPHKENFIPR